jgi:hypothetical protein
MTAEAKTDETTKWDGSDVCVAVHTAMRKLCDSKITSAAYNLIHLICAAKLKAKHSPWRLFGAVLAEHLNHDPKVDAANIAKRAANSLDDLYYERIAEPRRKEGKDAYPEGTRNWLHALQCTLQCFDEDDWAAAVAYLGPE